MNPKIADDLDHRIDTALHALGQVTPSTSLEGRILQALEGGLETPAQNGSRLQTLRPAKFFRILPLAAGAAVLLVVFVRFCAHPRPRPVERARSTPTTVQAPPHAVAEPSLVAASPVKSTQHASGRDRLSLHPVAVAADHGPKQSLPAAAEHNPLDEQALADFRAPSQPAPPLPPTAQERLFRLMLRRGEKVEIAKLDRARDPDLQRAEAAAFRNFFDPPSALHDEPSPSPKGASSTPTSSPQP